MIEIDGSFHEGGGQIIRTALSLSALTKQAIRISNIRAKRPNPGLGAQHLAAAKAVRSISRGTLSYCEIGGTEFTFEPGEIVGGKYEFTIGTAGSTILVAQTILPLLLFASKPSSVRITGGTHVMKSPSYDYFEKVFVPAISLFNARVKTNILKPGYYPKGGGEIELIIEPSELKGNETWPTETFISVLIRISGLPAHIAVREKKIFVQNNIEKVHIYEEDGEPANALLAWSGFFGSCIVGEKGKRAEVVAQQCLDFLMKEKSSGAEVDSYLADQLLLYAAIAKGRTKFKTSKITAHSETNAYVISKMLPERKISISGNEIIVK